MLCKVMCAELVFTYLAALMKLQSTSNNQLFIIITESSQALFYFCHIFHHFFFPFCDHFYLFILLFS